MIYGSHPTLLTVNYIKPDKKRGVDESFEVVYKDDNGVVHKTNEPAEADIYFVKPEFRNFNYNKPQERLEHLQKETVLVSQIRHRIAEEIGEEGLLFIKQCFENRDFKSLNRLYGWRYAFACDFQPEFYFMRSWYEKYKPGHVKLTKSFIDIETDIYDYTPDLDRIPGTAFAPVNCVTVVLDETKECFTFILRPFKPSKITYRDPVEYELRYKMYENQLAQHNKLMESMDDFIKDLHDSFDETYGELNYSIREYREEIDLIADVFRLLNDRKPNFCLIWNMRFDIQYLLERIKVLGYDPTTIMTHRDFQHPKAYFHVDQRVFQLEKQYDYFYCSSYTQYICQMRLYASIRKSQQMLKSVSLNAIGERELKDKKVEYPAESNIRTFAYVDWMRFIKYNIKDVLIQYGIEIKTDDVMTYYSKSHSNLTPYSKIFRETHLLRNVREMYFEKDGWVQGNNVNNIGLDEDDLFSSVETGDDEDNESTFKGAIMADPIWNDYVGVPILGVPSNNVFRNAMDYDMGAFYPSIKIASNMDPGTLLYKGEFDNSEFISGEFPNRSLNTIYQEKDKHGNIRNLDITGEAVNTYVSGNVLTFGYNYLGLPDIAELVRDVIKELR